LRRNLSLMACFADTDVLQGSVATYARCGGIFSTQLNQAVSVSNAQSPKICQQFNNGCHRIQSRRLRKLLGPVFGLGRFCAWLAQFWATAASRKKH